jgi:hypothetical protein
MIPFAVTLNISSSNVSNQRPINGFVREQPKQAVAIPPERFSQKAPESTRAVSPEAYVKKSKLVKERQRVCKFYFLCNLTSQVSELSLEEMQLMKSLERLEELCRIQKTKIQGNYAETKSTSRPSSSHSKGSAEQVHPPLAPKRDKTQIPNSRVRNRNRNPVQPQQVRPAYGKVQKSYNLYYFTTVY